MICNSCGCDNREDWVFCSNCGSRLEVPMDGGMDNPSDNSYDESEAEVEKAGPNSIDAIECPNCAANVKIDLSQDFAYCEYCGSCLSLVELRKEILEEEARIKEAEARIAEANALEAQANAAASQAYEGEGYYEEERPSLAREIAMGVAAAALNYRPRVMSTPYSRMGMSEPAYDYYPDYVDEPIPVPVPTRTASAPVSAAAHSISDSERAAVKTAHKPVEVHKPETIKKPEAVKPAPVKDYSSVMPSKTPVAVHTPVKKDISSTSTTSGLNRVEPAKEKRGLFGWGKPKPAATTAPVKPSTPVSKPTPVSRPTVSKPTSSSTGGLFSRSSASKPTSAPVSRPAASKPSSGGLFSKPSTSSSVSRSSSSSSRSSVSRPSVSKPSASRSSSSRPSVSKSVSRPTSRPSSSRSSGSKSMGGGKRR
ncbi:MAG: zinc ribbon domain-containing protein [Saccharofermentans sp.]|nr:zinc ribbon domain-containing protein [Saccharofermentans sp.]